MNVRLPDGTIITNVPEGTTKEELAERLERANIKIDPASKVRAAMIRNPGDLKNPPSPTAGMGQGSRFLAGVGKGLTDLAAGTMQAVGRGPSREEVAEKRRLDAPLMATGAGMTGNIVGQALPLVAAGAIPGANTVVGSGLLGAAAGAAQPVGAGESRLRNAARGGVAGAAVPAVVRVARTLNAVTEPAYAAGRGRIVGRNLVNSAQQPRAAIQSAQTATPPVPGYHPTLAEATRDPGLAVLQRGAQSADVPTAAALAQRGTEQVSALDDALRGIAGDDTSRAALEAARESATAPLYAAAKSATAKPDQVLATLMQRPSMSQAIARAGKLAQERGETLADPASGTMTGRGLHYIKMALDDMLDDAQSSIGRNERAAIAATREEFLNWLDTAIPQYGQARQTFAQMSRPINQAEVGQALREKLMPALSDSGSLPRVRAETYANSVRNAEQTARKATGFRGATLESTMTPEQMETIRGVSRALNMRANAADLGRGVGSNTAQNLAVQNVLNQSGLSGPAKVARAIMPSGARSWLTPGFAEMAEPAVQARRAMALLDPQDAAALMQGALTREQMARVLGVFQRYGINPAVVAGAISQPQQP